MSLSRLVYTEYPIEENIEESYEYFMVLYSLTMKANEVEMNMQPSISLLEVWWARIAGIWENETYLKHGVRIFDETLFHIRHKVFSPELDDPLLMKLVLLVEDELGKCGYAFHVWNKLTEFRQALSRTLHPKRGDLTWHVYHSWWYSAYLKGWLMKFVGLKNKSLEEWPGTMRCGDEHIYMCDRERFNDNIECFETAMKFLVPEANTWYEEWRDAGYMLNCLKKLYGIDFSNDSEGFDNLIYMVLHRKSVKYSAYYLYRMKTMPLTLAQHIWGGDADDMIMRCFTDIYHRYRRAKKNMVRSRYSQKALMESWMYKQIEDWYNTQPNKLADKVRTAYFNISLGIC